MIVLTVAKGFFQRNSFQKEVTHLLHCVEGSDILKQLISVGVTAVIMQKELLNWLIAFITESWLSLF